MRLITKFELLNKCFKLQSMKIIKLIFGILAVSVLVSCNSNSNADYKLSIDETFSILKNKKDFLTGEQLAKIITTNDTANYQFIDIRTPEEFETGHILNAINIPAKYILQDESKKLLKKISITKVIYCRDTYQAQNTYILLRQLGNDNMKIAVGGFEQIKANIIDSVQFATKVVSDEMARYDFQKIMSQTKNGDSTTTSAPSASPAKAAPIKREKKAVSGGCG